MQGGQHEFVLHLDVDAISSSDFGAATYGAGAGGMSLADAQKAMAIFAARPNMVALEVSTYNPTLDPDGTGAKVLVELLVGILTVRLAALESPAELAAEANHPVPAPVPTQVEPSLPEPSTEVTATTSELETDEPAESLGTGETSDA